MAVLWPVILSGKTRVQGEREAHMKPRMEGQRGSRCPPWALRANSTARRWFHVGEMCVAEGKGWELECLLVTALLLSAPELRLRRHLQEDRICFFG